MKHGQMRRLQIQSFSEEKTYLKFVDSVMNLRVQYNEEIGEKILEKTFFFS